MTSVDQLSEAAKRLHERVEVLEAQLEESRATVETLLEAMALQNGTPLPRWQRKESE